MVDIQSQWFYTSVLGYEITSPGFFLVFLIVLIAAFAILRYNLERLGDVTDRMLSEDYDPRRNASDLLAEIAFVVFDYTGEILSIVLFAATLNWILLIGCFVGGVAGRLIYSRLNDTPTKGNPVRRLIAGLRRDKKAKEELFLSAFDEPSHDEIICEQEERLNEIYGTPVEPSDRPPLLVRLGEQMVRAIRAYERSTHSKRSVLPYSRLDV